MVFMATHTHRRTSYSTQCGLVVQLIWDHPPAIPNSQTNMWTQSNNLLNVTPCAHLETCNLHWFIRLPYFILYEKWRSRLMCWIRLLFCVYGPLNHHCVLGWEWDIEWSHQKQQQMIILHWWKKCWLILVIALFWATVSLRWIAIVVFLLCKSLWVKASAKLIQVNVK